MHLMSGLRSSALAAGVYVQASGWPRGAGTPLREVAPGFNPEGLYRQFGKEFLPVNGLQCAGYSLAWQGEL